MNCKTIHHAANKIANNSTEDIICMIVIDRVYKEHINSFRNVSNFNLNIHANRKKGKVCTCVLCNQAKQLTAFKLMQHRLKKYLYYDIRGEYLKEERKKELELTLVGYANMLNKIKTERKKLKLKLGLL